MSDCHANYFGQLQESMTRATAAKVVGDSIVIRISCPEHRFTVAALLSEALPDDMMMVTRLEES